MRELLTVQDGGEGGEAPAKGDDASLDRENGGGSEDTPLSEEEVESIRQRTAAFLLGEGR